MLIKKKNISIKISKAIFFILFAFLFSFLSLLFLFSDKFVRSENVSNKDSQKTSSKKGSNGSKNENDMGYLDIGYRKAVVKKKNKVEMENEVGEYAFTPFGISAKLSSDGKSILISWNVPKVSDVDYVLVRYEDIINTPKKAKESVVLGIFPSEITEYKDVPDKLGEYYYAIFPQERDKKRIIIKSEFSENLIITILNIP